MKHFLISLLLLMSIFSCCNKNRLTVDYGNLDPNDFEIYLMVEDSEFHDIPVYKDGIYYDIPNWYGPNEWVITYKGQQQCRFGHLKRNRRYTHTYKFVVYENQDTLYCDIDIRGRNKMKETLHFTTIK